jgi:CheY-like chemotaxis protein
MKNTGANMGQYALYTKGHAGTDQSLDILLVDDNPGDIRLYLEAFQESKLCCNLHILMNGEEALAFLRRQAPYTDMPRPDLILLDLNLPRMNGHEVLARIKSDEQLRRIPIIVISVSRNEKDILAAYELQANCYISKPMDLAQWLEIVAAIEDFWFKTVQLPSQ